MATLSPPRPPASRPPALEPPRRPARRPPPWALPQARAAAADDVATLCLIAVTTAAGLGFGRLFTDRSFVPYVIGAAVLGHCTAWGLRRLAVGLAGALGVAALGSAMFAVWLVSPQDTTLGFLTPSTIENVNTDLATARELFHTSVPPVAPLPGFLLAVTFGVCLVAFLSDWAAFRMRATSEALVPAFVLFVITAIFGTPAHRTESVAAIVATSLLFLIVHRATLDAARGTWFGGRSSRALPSLLTTGALLGAAALAGGLLIGPRLPGATSNALVQLRSQGGLGNSGSRSTVSPLVDIRGRLINPTDTQVFKVRADRPSYWRLTSLDTFSGDIWSSNEKYKQTKGTLAPEADLIGRPLVQDVTISSLSSIWLPAAYRPQKISGANGVSYSERSASLISRDNTSDGLTYQLTSQVPELNASQLRSEPASSPSTSGLGADVIALSTPPRVDRRVTALVNRITANQRTSFDKAKALQDYLRTFTYDLNVGPGHSTDAITNFLLNTKRGYCEQFAGSFAVMARLIGLPSRVAVGFQPGLAQGNGTYSVRDKDAHAWPEVYFEGIGWVAFEPTPAGSAGGNGNPDAASYTGIPFRPAAGSSSATPETAPAAATPSGAAATTTTSATTSAKDAPTKSSASGSVSARAFLRVFLVLFGVIAAVGCAVGACWGIAERDRRRRRQAAKAPAERIALAWELAEEALGLVRVTRRSTTTVDEWLHRLSRPAGGGASAGVERGSAGHAALVRLGATVVDAAYGGPSVRPEAADQAEADSAVVVAAAREAAGAQVVLRWRLDPRPALAARRLERFSRRRGGGDPSYGLAHHQGTPDAG